MNYDQYQRLFETVDPQHSRPRAQADLRRLHLMKPWLPSYKSSVLDVGCGWGNTLLALKSLGYANLTGVDVSQGMCDVARDSLPSDIMIEHAENLSDWLGDHQGEFDFILMENVIEHIPVDEVVGVMSSLRHALSEAGYLFISTPNMASLFGAYGRYVDFTHVTGYTEGSLRQLLDLSGFGSAEILPDAPRRNPDLSRRRPWPGRDAAYYLRVALYRFLIWVTGVTPRPTTFRAHLDVIGRR